MEHSASITQFNVALHKAQFEMPTIKPESENKFFDATYADLTAVWKGIRKTLHDNGFSVMQGVIDKGGESQLPVLQTRVNHVSGEWMEDDGVPLIMEPNKKGNKTMQSMGSAITYARRQGLSAMLGITTSDEDDDGASASATLPSRIEPKAGEGKPNVKKMTGPIKTKKELTEKCAELVKNIAVCADAEQLSNLRSASFTKKLMDQLENDWPEAHSTERNPDHDFVGIVQRFNEREAELSGG